MFCTSQGVTWQFRETPYTSEFPEVQERHASERTPASYGLRWKSRDGRPAGTPPMVDVHSPNYLQRPHPTSKRAHRCCLQYP
jgi:hypothetical protein